MKVLHICSYDLGGAGLCCLRINDALKKAGIESNVLVLIRKSGRDDVHELGYYRWFFWRLLNKCVRLLGLSLNDFNRIRKLIKQLHIALSLPTSIFDVSKSNLVKEDDIIHLHWVGDFVDLPSFSKKVNKPIVWTLHDENLFCGIRHYEEPALNSPLESKYYEIKLKSIKRINNLGIVFLSNMMYESFHNREMVKGRQTTIINNSVDYEAFKPLDKQKTRHLLGINNESIVFVFVAASINDKRKGLDLLSETLQRMNIPNVVILAVGDNKDGIKRKNVISIGAKYSSEELCAAYSCGDYFVMPSNKEAFAQTPLEAMACGLPVIAFPVSGIEELINEKNGVICDGFTSDSLERGLRTAMNRNYSSEYIRQNIIDNFSPEVMAEKYIKFYGEIITGQSD